MSRARRGVWLTATLVVIARNALADDPRLELLAHAGYADAGSRPVATYRGAGTTFPTLENGQVAPFRGSFAAEVGGGWRFTRALSVGAVVGLRLSSVDSSVNLATDADLSRSAWTLGGYVRWSPELDIEWLGPWASVGIGIAMDSQSFTYGTEAASGPTTLRNLGLAVPLQAGVGFRLMRSVSLGPFASYSPVLGFAAASSGVGASDHVEARTYAVWGAGVEVRVVVF